MIYITDLNLNEFTTVWSYAKISNKFLVKLRSKEFNNTKDILLADVSDSPYYITLDTSTITDEIFDGTYIADIYNVYSEEEYVDMKYVTKIINFKLNNLPSIASQIKKELNINKKYGK